MSSEWAKQKADYYWKHFGPNDGKQSVEDLLDLAIAEGRRREQKRIGVPEGQCVQIGCQCDGFHSHIVPGDHEVKK
jgi:hypothetical protein